jgi:hypothetical protein
LKSTKRPGKNKAVALCAGYFSVKKLSSNSKNFVCVQPKKALLQALRCEISQAGPETRLRPTGYFAGGFAGLLKIPENLMPQQKHLSDGIFHPNRLMQQG